MFLDQYNRLNRPEEKMNLKEMKLENKLIFLAIICGLAAGVLTFMSLSMKEKSIETAMDPVQVVVADRIIPQWTRLDETLVKYGTIPKKYFTKAYITDMKQIEGKITMVPFGAEEPVLNNKLSESGNELNTAIPGGLRAMTVSVDEESGIGYMAKPGDYVDILLTFERADGKAAYTMTATILQSVRVIAVGSDYSVLSRNRSYTSMTLALTPEEVEILTFAKNKGRLNFSLRAIGDRVKEKLKKSDFEDLISQINKNEKGDEVTGNNGEETTGEKKQIDPQIKAREE
jgi:pilus assembly protein CpaB